MSEQCGGSTKHASADDPNISIKKKMNGKLKISNRICSFSRHDTWKEILAEIAFELDKTAPMC